MTDKVRIIPISSTILDEVDLCEYFYYLRRKRRLVPFMNAERLDRGAILHRILAAHYTLIGLNMNLTEKINYQEIIEKSIENGLVEAGKGDLGKFEIEKVIETYRMYADHYQNDNWYPVLDQLGKPIVEAPFSKVLYEGPDHDGGTVRIVVFGKIDLMLYRPSMTGGERIVVDHKSGERYVALNPLANQYYTYSWATGVRKVGQNNAGFQKADNENKFRRDFYSFQADQIEEWVDETVKKVMLLDGMAAQEYYPRRTTGCFKFGPCQYLDICAAIPKSRDAIMRMRFKTAASHNVYQEEGDNAAATQGPAADPVVEAQETVPPLREQEGGDSVSSGQDAPVPPVREDGGPRGELRDETTDLKSQS